MTWTTPADAMPRVGLYICAASLVCTLAIAADVFRGFRKRKLCFPCRFFTIIDVSITVITISTKLPLNLSTNNSDRLGIGAKFVSIMFLVPTLGLMNDKELLLNTVALCILIFTITGNMQRVLQQRYKELHRLISNSNHQEINFSNKRLIRYVKKYWIMTEIVMFDCHQSLQPLHEMEQAPSKRIPSREALDSKASALEKQPCPYAYTRPPLQEAMPWVGLYICVASLVCTLAMAADAFQGFRQWKLWFPCRFFSINAAAITLMAVAMKLPVDLSDDMSDSSHDMLAKMISILFLVTMLANSLRSLGIMNDRELLLNIIALGILIITITVNVLIQFSIMLPFPVMIPMLIFIFSLLWPFSVALTVPETRRILQHQYKELQGLVSNHQEINFSSKALIIYAKKYWMMAETDYKWSIDVILILQLLGATVGSIAPIFRCLTATSHFKLSQELSKNHLNVFRVEKQRIQRLQMWKSSHVSSHILGRHCKMVFHNIKNMILNIFIAVKIMVVVICNTICLIPITFLIFLSCTYYFCKSLLRSFKEEADESNIHMRSEMEEYVGYVLQIEVKAKLSKKILRNMLNSMTRLLHESEKKEPDNLMTLLKKSTGFYGVIEFDNEQVPPLHSEEIQSCWSLVAVTLTAIALSLPKANFHVQG
ncbi:hypothetical protein Lser_V15G01824 [Lactuca serriola]